MSAAVCRVCVVGDGVRMHNIDEELQEIYEKLTSTKLCTSDDMPNTVCYICYSLLQKCQKFSAVALQSENFLRHQFISGIKKISHKPRPCPLLNLEVVENLSVTVAQSMFTDDHINESQSENRHAKNYLCITENTPIVKVEIDVKKERLTGDVEDLVKTEQMIIEDTYYDSLNDSEHSLKESNIVKNSKISCEICKNIYNTKKQMQSHMKTHSKDKSFVCGKCNKSFFLEHNLKKHFQTCFKPITCSSCNQTFTKIANLKRHMRTHSEERPFICDRCSNKFKTRTHLKVHMRIHGGERPFACDICSKAFTQISNLKTHMKIHEGAKPFACEICGKAFLTNGTLKSHMKCHTGERPFKCNTCGMTFGFKCSLNQHIRRLHTEVKAYPCNRCHLSFNHEVGLSGHMRAHTAERAYPCDKCSKAFTSARNLKGHNMQVHSGERPHSCNKCGKSYKRPEHLRQHFKSFKCKSVTASDISK